MKPIVQIEYEGAEATRWLAPRLVQAVVAERFNERLSELELGFEDRDGRWRGSWFPKAEDKIRVKMGYEGRLRDFGEYVVSEVNYDGDSSGERIEIRGASASEKAYQKRWQSYRNKTMKQVIEEVATRNGFEVAGRIAGAARMWTQDGESDLAFLHRLAKREGYALKVEGKTMVFYPLAEIEASEIVMTIRREAVKSYRFSDKAIGSYRKCVVKGFNAKTRQVLEGAVGSGEPVLALIESGIDSASEARERAREALKEANRKKTRAEIALVGETRLVAGLTVNLQGFGAFDGKYVVEETRHRFSSGGYETEFEGVKE